MRTLEASVALCPVCGRKVGSWHPDGVHPKCAKMLALSREPEPPEMADAIQLMTQAQRDQILRRLPTKTSR